MFLKYMEQDAFCSCVGSCPYDITQYMNKCPKTSHDNDSTELSFLFAVTALGKLATHDVLKTTHLTKTAPIFYLFSTVQQCYVKWRLFFFPSTVQQCFGPTAP
jgi:hypothetical protein